MKRENFIEKATAKHGNKYDYSSIIDTANIKNKYKIICFIHGEFEQRGDAHLSGQGCGKCGNSVLSNINEFIKKANKVHNNKYDYSKVVYFNSKKKIAIICPIHNIFYQSPDSHLSGHGCPKCGFNVTSSIKKYVAGNNFIKKANKIHNDKYKYPDFKYVNAKGKIKIDCPTHGTFHQMLNDHLCGKGCPKCGIFESKKENEIRDFIENELNIKTKKIRIDNKEIDIYMPKHKLGIEFNGLYWHSDIFKEKNYHLNKTELCEKHGIQLLHIFEDEWIYKKEIVKSIIKSKLGMFNTKIFARKCIIKELSDNIQIRNFLENNHIQGFVGSNLKIGLFYNNQLISIMTFGKKRISNGEYKILRFCNKLNTVVIGGADRLLNYFVKIYTPKEIITLTDRRYFNGNLFNQLGFKFVGNTQPNYFYFKKHKILKKYRKKRSGCLKINDCGNKKHILKLINFFSIL